MTQIVVDKIKTSFSVICLNHQNNQISTKSTFTPFLSSIAFIAVLLYNMKHQRFAITNIKS